MQNRIPEVAYLPASAVKETPDLPAFLRTQGIIPITVNDIYWNNRNRPERVQILYGGSGSGKSDFKATELLVKCLTRPLCRVLFLRKHSEQIRDSQFLLFKDIISRYGLERFFRVKESEMDIICINGNVLLSAGLDDVDKLKSIPEITDAWIEEPLDRRGSILSTDFTELNRRLRTPKAPNHIHLTFNPISKESWIYDYFFRSDLYNAFKLRTTYKDNYFIPADQEHQFDILRENKPDEFAVYALGQWGSLKQGLVFPEYKIVDEFPADCRRSGYGLDWGFSPDPCALIRCGIKEGGLYLDEVMYEYNLNAMTRAQVMKSRGLHSASVIVADSASPESIATSKALGFSLIEGAKKGPGSVKAGIDLMRNYTIYITARSQNLKTELDNYSWAVDRRTGSPTGEPLDEFNHAIDAARYWVTRFAAKRQNMPTFV